MKLCGGRSELFGGETEAASDYDRLVRPADHFGLLDLSSGGTGVSLSRQFRFHKFYPDDVAPRMFITLLGAGQKTLASFFLWLFQI